MSIARLSVLAALPIASVAHAQVIATPGPIPGGISNSAAGTFNVSSFDTFGLAQQGFLASASRTDWSWQLPRSNFTGHVLQSQYYSFRIGMIPVQIDSLSSLVNGKWVNGGGTGATPTTSINWTTRIDEIIPGVGLVNVLSLSPAAPTVISGNGLSIINQADSMASTYVLASGRQYVLTIDITTEVVVSNWNDAMPSISITNEFGGPLSPNFNGLQAQMTWHEVPAPAPLALLGLAGLIANRRNRIAR